MEVDVIIQGDSGREEEIRSSSMVNPEALQHLEQSTLEGF